MTDQGGVGDYFGYTPQDAAQADAGGVAEHFGYDPQAAGSGDLTDDQRDMLVRWGLDPRQHTRQTAPIETPEGLRDPQTHELVVAGRAPTAGNKTQEWGPAQAVANGALQGLGPKLQAGLGSLRSDAPAGAYEQAKAHYDAQRGAYNAAHPHPLATNTELQPSISNASDWLQSRQGAGPSLETLGSAATSIPLMAAGGAVVSAAGRAAADTAPAIEPAVNFLLGQGGKGLAQSGNALTRYIAAPATRLSSLATAGAGAGATNALLSQNLSDAPIEDQMATGAMFGAGLGVALAAAWGVIRGAGRFAQGAAEPADSITNRFLYEQAGNRESGAISPLSDYAGAREVIPGSQPTLSQALAEPGLVGLERGLRNMPDAKNAFVERDVMNSRAREAALQNVEGDQASLEALKTARDQATRPLRMRALQNAPDTDSSSAVSLLDRILASPSGQRDDVVKTLNNIRKKLVTGETTDAAGNTVETYQNDPRQLYGIRKSIGDLLDKSNATDAASSAKLASAELLRVRDQIDRSITKVAPDFSKYLKTYADMSKPIDSQELLQGMTFRNAQGNVTRENVNRAVNTVEAQRAAGGVNKAKSLAPEHTDTLNNLLFDLRRANNLDLGKAMGSPTIQNALQHGALGSLGALPVSAAELAMSHVPLGGYMVNKLLQARNAARLGQLTNNLTEKMLNPNTAITTPRNALRGPDVPANEYIPYSVPAGTAAYKLLYPNQQ